MRKKLLAGSCGLVLLAVIGASRAPQEPKSKALSLKPENPETSAVPRPTLRLAGTTFAEKSADLRAPRLRGERSRGTSSDWGLVLVQLAPAGTLVKKGDVVARFDPLFMETRLDDMKALRIERETAVNVLRSDLDVQRISNQQSIARARAKAEKAQLDLGTAPVRSEIQNEIYRLAREEADLEFKSLQSQTADLEASLAAQLRIAELQLAEAVVEEKRAKANLDRMMIRTPVDGIVVIPEIFRGSEFGAIQVGDQVSPGQYYMQIADRQHMVVRAMANQSDIERIRVGAHAWVHFEAFPELSLPATVYAIAPMAESGGLRPDHVKRMAVYLRLQAANPQVIPDLTVAADIELHDNQVRVTSVQPPVTDATPGS